MKNIKELKTMTARQLGLILCQIESEHKKPVKVVIASDEEGNSYGTIVKNTKDQLGSFAWINKKQGLLCIYPFQEFIDFDNDLD